MSKPGSKILGGDLLRDPEINQDLENLQKQQTLLEEAITSKREKMASFSQDHEGENSQKKNAVLNPEFDDTISPSLRREQEGQARIQA